MNKDEILAKSRSENKKQDEYYAEVNKSSMRVGMLTVVAVCVILMAVEYFVYGECNLGYIVIITVVNAALNLYKGIKLKDKAFIISGLIWSVATVIDVANYIMKLVG